MHSGFLKWFDPKLEIYVHRSLINCLVPDPDYKQLITPTVLMLTVKHSTQDFKEQCD